MNEEGELSLLASAARELTLLVRDYECDLQGVVNNAVYQNYLEHARHEFLKAEKIDFAALAKEGINLMVIKAVLNYKGSLTSGDNFIIHTSLEKKSRLKFVFIQTITNQDNAKVVLSAEITGVAVNAQGQPFLPEVIATLMA